MEATPTLPLTTEQELNERYITAYHELNRLRHFSPTRLNQVAKSLQLSPQHLSFTWCLLQATTRTRRRTLPTRKGVGKSYRQLLHACPNTRGGATKRDVALSREALLAASSRGMENYKRAFAMLRGEEVVLNIREEAVYEDGDQVSIDDLCRSAIGSLPRVDSVDEPVVEGIVKSLTNLVKGFRKEASETGLSECVQMMVEHRKEALLWQERGYDGESTGLEGLLEECGIKLHPVAKRALEETFLDEDALAEGGLSAFRTIVPIDLERAVEAREISRLMGWMKTPDRRTAERLIGRYGSARRALRATEDGEVMTLLHGYDACWHACVRGLRDVWLVCRVLKDCFGTVEDARKVDFGVFVKVVEEVWLTLDERLRGYCCVHRESAGEERRKFLVSWGVFKSVCMAGVEEVVEVSRKLLEGMTEDGILVLDDDLWTLCIGLGLDSDHVVRLRRYLQRFINH